MSHYMDCGKMVQLNSFIQKFFYNKNKMIALITKSAYLTLFIDFIVTILSNIIFLTMILIIKDNPMSFIPKELNLIYILFIKLEICLLVLSFYIGVLFLLFSFKKNKFFKFSFISMLPLVLYNIPIYFLGDKLFIKVLNPYVLIKFLLSDDPFSITLRRLLYIEF